MAEQKSVDSLLKQIADFENTIKSLQVNVETLKKRLAENRAKYGDDISQWPKEEK